MNTALGVLNLGISRSPAEDRHILTELAHAHGYDLIDVLTIDDCTYMPTAYIAERVRTARATALLAPSFEHFGVSARVLPLIAELVVPGAAGHGHELERQSSIANSALTQQHRVRRRGLAAAALILLLFTAWALWPAPDSASPPAPAVIVLPDQAEGR